MTSRSRDPLAASIAAADRPGVSPAGLAPIPTATGSQQLLRVYNRNLGTALLLAAAVHAAGLGLYWGVSAMEPPEAGPREIILSPENFTPSIAESPPRQPSDAAAPARVASGIPQAVPNEQASPDATIASREDAIGESPSDVGARIGVVHRGTSDVPAMPDPPAPPPLPTASDVFEVVEQMPELIGGLASIRPIYPEMERRIGVEGRVFVQFVVIEDGTVTDVTVTRGVSPGLDRAAMDAVRGARFHPGMQRGRPVRVRFSLPVNFRLN